MAYKLCNSCLKSNLAADLLDTLIYKTEPSTTNLSHRSCRVANIEQAASQIDLYEIYAERRS